MGPKIIDDARGQGLLGADHGQADLVVQRPLTQRGNIAQRDMVKPGIQGRTTIARRHMDRLHPGRLRQLPGQSMFATASAYNENLHSYPFRARQRLSSAL